MQSKIGGILIGIIILLALLFIGARAVGQSERNECVKWGKQSKEYPRWESTNWQKSQCLRYSVKLK
jgi:hypothetical protein